MWRALALAALADGWTHPNPMVGAVVVRSGRIVGEGYHRLAGMPHAEIEALRQAGRRARGADLYVTLEPCCHYGRTPPCTEAIIAAGITRVFYGMRDPNARMRGRGLRALRQAGIRVIGPIAAPACRTLNAPFIHWATTGRPYVIAKVAMSLDGKIADSSGRSRWITNAAVRAYGHAWRARVDGILIGRATLVKDNPRLTVRLPRSRGYRGPQPQPIILVGNGAIPRQRTLVTAGVQRPALWIAPKRRLRTLQWLARRGHELFGCPAGTTGHDLAALLRYLGRRGMTAVLIEGGGSTLGAFLRAGLVNHLVVGVAPIVLGGSAKGWTDALFISTLRRALTLDMTALQRFGDNIVVEGAVRKRDP